MRGVPSIQESWSRPPRPPQLSLRGVPTVQNHGHDCLEPRDFCCALTAQGELRRVMVPPSDPNIATSRVDRGPPCICHATPPLRNPNVQCSERLYGKGCWSHPRVHNLSRGGSGGHCRYLEDQVPPRTSFESRQKTRRMHMPACLVALAPASQAQGSSGAATCPVAPSPGSAQLRSRHVFHGSSSHHQAPGQLRDRHVPPGL
jgi:hypothetical protein